MPDSSYPSNLKGKRLVALLFFVFKFLKLVFKRKQKIQSKLTRRKNADIFVYYFCVAADACGYLGKLSSKVSEKENWQEIYTITFRAPAKSKSLFHQLQQIMPELFLRSSKA